MNILVTNDDGVDNPGIWALVRAVKDLANSCQATPTFTRNVVLERAPGGLWSVAATH